MKEKLIRLNEVFRITNRAEENIRLKIEAGLINKYDKRGNILDNPLQQTGYFKLTEVLRAYNITDYEEKEREFKRKRKKIDSVVSNIIPSQIKIINSLNELKKLESKSIDTCISFFPYSEVTRTQPYIRNIDDRKKILSHRLWIKEIVRILNKKGNFLVHSTPEYLPYYAIYLEKHLYFKYWIVNLIHNHESIHRSKGLLPITNGTLFFLKSDKGFRLNRIRETVHCEYCKNNIKDYGGKKLLIHQNGAIISDVWKTITQDNGKISDELLSRLINLSCDEKSKLLLAPLGGSIHKRYQEKLYL